MRKPTAKERSVMEGCVKGLREDIEALTKNPSRDVFGTFYVNTGVLTSIVKKLEGETFDREDKT